MSAGAKHLYIFDDDKVEVSNVQSTDTLYKCDDDDKILIVYEGGPKGDKGDQGTPGFSGAGEPFYVITSGSLYGTTASLAIFSDFSSSLNPWTSSLSYTDFSLGSINKAWKGLYVSESIYFIKSGSQLVNIKPNPGNIQIGNTIVATSSLGFVSAPVISEITSGQQEFKIMSGSVTGSMVNRDGVFGVGDFSTLPPLFPGSIVKSGSDFYVGI